MKTSQELRTLVLDNIKLVEDAYEVFKEVNGEIWRAITELMSKMVDEDAYFEEFKPDNSVETFRFGRGKAYKDKRAYFYFDYDAPSIGKEWLGILGGCYPPKKAGLFFYYDWEGQGISKCDWKNFLREFYNANPSLVENDISLCESGTELVRYVSLDLNCVAENPDDPANCLDSFREAFEALSAEGATFDKLVKRADKEFATE